MIESLIDQIRDTDELTIIHNTGKKMFILPYNCQEILFDTKNRLFADYIIAPWIINKLNPDITWFPGSAIPFFIKSKTIITLHDLGYYIKELNAYKYLDTLYWKIMMRSSCKRATKIIAISENTKKAIQEILGIPEEKIAVIYEAVDTNRFRKIPKATLENIATKYSLPRSFFLFTGGLSPRKNLTRLFRAIELLDEENVNLVVTGDTFASWSNDQECKLIEESDKIKHLGYVNEDELVALYNLADAYIFPSLYEGLGLPILEAQACGCPVISSSSSSLPEVGGNSVLYFNPHDEMEIVRAIKTLVNNPKKKDNLVEKGYENIKRFSWGLAARQLLNIFDNIAK